MKYPIDIKERVSLGGFKQRIHIWGTGSENPVLLILHGGPGVPNRYSIPERHSDLFEDFTVVAWDQRGTGGSYFGCDPETLTLKRLVLDCAELIDYLCEKLGKEKLFLLGGSWGTELGTFVCRDHPDRVAGYVGYGQVVNGIENEKRSYVFAMKMAQAAGDMKSVAALERVGPPVNGQYNPVFEGLMTQRRILSKYGGHSVKKESYLRGTALPILRSRELSPADKLGVLKGYKLCLTQMWPTLVYYDFTAQRLSFKMPYYIFQGRMDENTPASLIEEYYESITAPDKALVWFENSAHGPLGEEPEKFKELLREKLLNNAEREK